MKTSLISLLLCATGIATFACGNYWVEENPLIAHEWGTFTSVQGADGFQMEWNPLTTTELPSFVYDLNRPNGASRGARFASFSSKNGMLTRQRMETPVIYFYSPKPTTVDVKVSFPEGVITEWYPQVAPVTGPQTPARIIERQKSLHWAGIEISPAAIDDERLALLPSDKSGSHYYAARETDGCLLNTGMAQKEEREKFLFYRGVGSFEAPLKVSFTGQDARVLRLKNTGPEAIGEFFILSIRQGQGKWLRSDRLAAEEEREVELNPDRSQMPARKVVMEVSAAMEETLVKEGLYLREAAAMVKTWRDSWLEEHGVRVLYVLPRTWTDRTLPMNISPKPAKLARVMVGRAEVITPAMEWDLVKQVIRFTEGNDATKRQAANSVRNELGRFAEPALRHLQGAIQVQEFSMKGWELLQAAAKPAEPPRPLASAAVTPLPSTFCP